MSHRRVLALFLFLPALLSAQTQVSIILTQPWTDTGVQVTQGAGLDITASGQMDYYGTCPTCIVTPAGLPSVCGAGFAAPGLACYSLVGRIGSDGVPFEVGTSLQTTASSSGELFLGVNDNYFPDNSGSWTASVSSQIFAQSTFVYVNNNVNGSNSVSAFSVGGNGALTAVAGSPFATGGSGTGGYYYASNGIAATVVGNRLYASDSVSNDIAAFTINANTGALTPVPDSPFVYGSPNTNPFGISLAVTPNGQFLYAGDGGNGTSGDIWGFSIGSNGALTPLTGSPFASTGSVDGINVTRDGKYLAAAQGATLDGVATFSIGSGGALTAVEGSPFSTGGDTAYVDINCASDLLFASDATSGETTEVSVETITNGALSAITDSPFTFSVGGNSNVGVLSPNGTFLFVSNQQSNTVTSLNVAAGGSLAEVTGSPFVNSGTGMPTLMGTNQAGTLLYVVNDGHTNDNTVSAFTIGGDGGLTLVSGSPFDTGAAGSPSLTVFPPKTCGTVNSTPGPFAYVANSNSNTVSVINLPTSLVVNAIPVGSDPRGVAVSPGGNQVYVGNTLTNDVSVIDTASSSVMATIPVQSSPYGVAFTPDGTSVYVVNGGSNSVSVIDTASQTVVATVPVQNKPIGVAMALTSNGTFAYVTNVDSNTVSVIAVGSNPTVVQTIPVGAGPNWVVVSPNSSQAYVASWGSNTVSVISVATNTVTATIPVGLIPSGVAFTPDGRTAYVANQTSNTLSVIDTASASVVATVAGFNDPILVAMTPDGSSAYVTNLSGNNVSVVSTATNTITGTVAVGLGPVGVAIASAPPTELTITQPLTTGPVQFNFGPHSYNVQYPPGASIPAGEQMTVTAAQSTLATYQQSVAGTPFANSTCIVYSGTGGNCVNYQVTCSVNGNRVTCPPQPTPNISVKTSYDTLQTIVNPGFLTAPIGTNEWQNIFSQFYLQRIDPSTKGFTKGFSQFYAVALGASSKEGAETFTFLAPLLSTDPRVFGAGVEIPVEFRLTPITKHATPITSAVADLTVVMVSNASGTPESKVVLSRKNTFEYQGAGDYLYQMNTAGFADGTYILTVYGNSFAAQQVPFSINSRSATKCVITPSSSGFYEGQPITFTGTVTPVPPATGTPTGTVTFQDNSNSQLVLGTASLVGGEGSITAVLKAPPDRQFVNATYSGDNNFKACESPYTTMNYLP
jgi:YVTN family beta-propeller protein